jgi:DNA repair exonuclease SbcCD ATPase subunit
MPKLHDDIDSLFRLPLTEFISARKTLAAKLKKNGYPDEAERVKSLAKPSVSAWTVNQLYWHHREAFDELIATGQRFRKAQTSGKMANMREALDARRDALSQLSDLAAEVLRDGGHNPGLDTLRRIATTLEALSAATSSDGPTPGQLTHDVDPPGFESFGSFTPSAATARPAAKPPQAKSSKQATAVTKTQPTSAARTEAREHEERQARINAAKASLQDARKALTAARAQAKSLEAAQKRSEAVAKEAENQKRQAEERFKKATAASKDAADRASSIAVELKEATKALDEAKRDVEQATNELEISFRESPGRRKT